MSFSQPQGFGESYAHYALRGIATFTAFPTERRLDREDARPSCLGGLVGGLLGYLNGCGIGVVAIAYGVVLAPDETAAALTLSHGISYLYERRRERKRALEEMLCAPDNVVPFPQK